MRAYDEYIVQRVHAVNLGEQLVDHRVPHTSVAPRRAALLAYLHDGYTEIRILVDMRSAHAASCQRGHISVLISAIRSQIHRVDLVEDDDMQLRLVTPLLELPALTSRHQKGRPWASSSVISPKPINYQESRATHLSASANSFRTFSSDSPTYFESTSGPWTTLGSLPFSILPGSECYGCRAFRPWRL